LGGNAAAATAAIAQARTIARFNVWTFSIGLILRQLCVPRLGLC
jgi:hypothetical protein